MSVLETLVAPWGTWTDKSHGHSARAVRWLTAVQFIIRYTMPEQTIHVPHPLYNPVAQGNWPHSLANLPTTLYLNIESIDANIDGSEFYI